MSETIPTDFVPATVPWPIRVVNYLRYDATALLCAAAIGAPFAAVGLLTGNAYSARTLITWCAVLGGWAACFWLAARLLKVFITGGRGSAIWHAFLIMNLTTFFFVTLSHLAFTGRRMSLFELKQTAVALTFPYVLLLVALPIFEWAVKRLARSEERRRLAGEYLAVQRREWNRNG